MKILISVSNHLGGQEHVSGMLACLSQHTVKVAGYYRSTYLLDSIDWTLDCFYLNKNQDSDHVAELWGLTHFPARSTSDANLLRKGIEEFWPDLIISDCEPLVAGVASELGIRLWYCSNLLAVRQRSFSYGLYQHVLGPLNRLMISLPPAERYLVPSPFGCCPVPPLLPKPLEWIEPFSNLVTESSGEEGLVIIPDQTRFSALQPILMNLSPQLDQTPHQQSEQYMKALESAKWILTSGETQYCTDALLNHRPLVVAPNLHDPEAVLNAALIEKMGLGINVGQIENAEEDGITILEQLRQNLPKVKPMKLQHKSLTELVG